MIVVITHYEIYRAHNKRTRNGYTDVPTQTNGKPRKIWLIEMGYSSDTRHMDKVNIQNCAKCFLQKGMT
jgi:hypothetical protein